MIVLQSKIKNKTLIIPYNECLKTILNLYIEKVIQTSLYQTINQNKLYVNI